jgi:hypothetical protein
VSKIKRIEESDPKKGTSYQRAAKVVPLIKSNDFLCQTKNIIGKKGLS